jgi:hypothetical protein
MASRSSKVSAPAQATGRTSPMRSPRSTIAGLHSLTRISRPSAAHRNTFGRVIENIKRPIGICIVLAAGIAAAHEGSDPLAVWYRSLTTADGKSCCSMHDCAPAEARLKEGRWEVLIFPYNADDARWFPVPDHAVLWRENPDGRPILCRTPNGFIHCFVPPPGA